MDSNSLKRILDLVYKYTGISMAENKKTLLQGRLRPRMKELSFEDYDQYVNYVESTKEEVQRFINLVTTNETSFFRTGRVWDFLQKEYLQDWFSNNQGKILKIWSAASSTGEEVYTIGICCNEFKIKNPSFNYQILGTDIDTDVVAFAEKGEYQGRSVENFKALNRALFDKYMKPLEDGVRFKVIDDVRSKIKFGIHNLFKMPSQKNYYDLIFLRNVLIYFEPKDQEIVLSNVSLGLVENGRLVVGESESLSHLKTKFQFKAPLIYAQTGS